MLEQIGEKCNTNYPNQIYFFEALKDQIICYRAHTPFCDLHPDHSAGQAL